MKTHAEFLKELKVYIRKNMILGDDIMDYDWIIKADNVIEKIEQFEAKLAVEKEHPYE